MEMIAVLEESGLNKLVIGRYWVLGTGYKDKGMEHRAVEYHSSCHSECNEESILISAANQI